MIACKGTTNSIWAASVAISSSSVVMGCMPIITDIVRGADLLDSTPRHLYLQELLGQRQPHYLHVPLIVQPDGHKLGKRYRSPPLDSAQAGPLLLRALRALGQQPVAELDGAAPPQILAWAIAHWSPDQIARTPTLLEAQLS
jgi:glutamyl-Q tRNA(Asp) synthetase